MNTYKVWFTAGDSYEEDFLIVQATTAGQAYENVMKANSDLYGFDIQSVEEMDEKEQG